MRHAAGGSVRLTRQAALAESLPRPAGPAPRPAPATAASAAGRRSRSPRARGHRAGLSGRQRWGAGYLGVLCGVTLSLSYLWRGPQNVRGGTLAVAGLLLAAAAARLVLPEERAGMLVSRRRMVDVAAFCVLGIGLLVAGLVFPAQH